MVHGNNNRLSGNKLNRRSAFILRKTVLALAVAQSIAAPLEAATLTVNSLEDTIKADGSCTLREAIASIANGVVNNDCPNSGGAFGSFDFIRNIVAPPATINLGSVISLNSPTNNLSVQMDLNSENLVPAPGARIFQLNDANVTINNAVLSQANVTGNGGAVDVYYSTLTMRNSRLINNVATQRGGAIYADVASHVRLENTEVAGNSARIGGAISLEQSSSVELVQSTVSSNSSNLSSGAVHLNRSSEIKTYNSTFYRNSAGTFGGTIYAQNESVVTLRDTTLNQNSAFTKGGGVFIFQDSQASITRSILAGSGKDDCYVSNDSSVTSDAASIIQDGTCNTSARPLNPQLSGFNRISEFSPARITGITICEPTDQRGQGRVDGECDAGSFEFNNMVIEVDSTQDNGTGCDLRQAIASTQVDGFRSSCTSDVPEVLFNDGTLTIRFDPNLSGSALALSYGSIDIAENQAVLVDASNLSRGVTIDAQSNQRHFTVDKGSLSLNSLTLINGSANSYGGAIDISNGNLSIENSSLSSNIAGRGGAVAARSDSTLTMRNSQLNGNTATLNSYSGGALYIANSYTEVLQSTLANNHAAGIGGGVTLNLSEGAIIDSTISSNRSDRGGGISIKESNFYILGSTISGNSAIVGGGVYAFRQSRANIRHSTIAGNMAVSGGGIALDFSTARLRNSIIADSTNGDCYDVGSATFEDSNSTIIEDGSCGGRDENPRLLPLANNGGPTQTHVLAENSPARGAGNPLFCVSVDQRGFPVNADIDGCDLGSTEFQSSDVPVNFFVIPLPNGRTLTIPL